MKYKIIINGRNNALVTDFIQHTDMFFDTLSTSDCWQDIIKHFNVFPPDAYVCFVEPDYEKTVKQINTLKGNAAYNGAIIVLIADSDTCDLIEENSPFTANIIIRRPVTPDNLALKITRYFEDLEAAKKRLEAKKEAQRAEEAAREAAREAEIEARAVELAASMQRSAAQDGAKKHILIVDDDRTILKMLKSALGEEYEVTTMINGVMVDKAIDAKPIDLIILDYEMPIETGADIFRRVKKNPKAANIPVCFLTGVSEREKIMEVMSLKPHGYLLKPIDMNMLMSTIKNLTV